MASLRKRLTNLFSTNVIVRAYGKDKLRVVDTNRLQSVGNLTHVFSGQSVISNSFTMNSEKINGLRITNKCLSNIFLLFKGHSVTAVCIYVTSCLRWGKIEEKTHEKQRQKQAKLRAKNR